MTQPEANEPMAMPMPIPVITQVMPSVNLAAGTSRSTRAKAVMKVGEIAAPLTNRASARSLAATRRHDFLRENGKARSYLPREIL